MMHLGKPFRSLALAGLATAGLVPRRALAKPPTPHQEPALRRSPVCRLPAPWLSAAMRYTSAPKAMRSMASLWQVGLPCEPRPARRAQRRRLLGEQTLCCFARPRLDFHARAWRQTGQPSRLADQAAEPSPPRLALHSSRARRSAVHFDRLTVQHLPARGSAGDDHQHQPKRWGPPAHGLGHPQLGRLRLEWRDYVFHRQWRGPDGRRHTA